MARFFHSAGQRMFYYKNMAEKSAYCCEDLFHLCDMVTELKNDLESNEERLEFLESQPGFQHHDPLYQRYTQIRVLLLKNRSDICLKIGVHSCHGNGIAYGTGKVLSLEHASPSMSETKKRKLEAIREKESESQADSTSTLPIGRIVHSVNRSSPFLYQELITDPSFFNTGATPAIQFEAYQKAKKTLTSVIKRIHDNDMVVFGVKGERINVSRYRELMAIHKDSLADGTVNISELFKGTWTSYITGASSKKKSVNLSYVFIPQYAIA